MRGSFLYPDRAKQLIDYGSLDYKGMHPTDLDGAFELDNNKLVIFEYKYNGAPSGSGQRILQERLCDHWDLQGESLIILADHYVSDTNIPVTAGDAIVRKIYYKSRWIDYTKYNKSVKTVFENFFGEDLWRRMRSGSDEQAI